MKNEPEQYTRDELTQVLGEPIVRGIEMLSSNPNRRLLAMEIEDDCSEEELNADH